jgi:DNA-binding NtrC family response regulator
MSNEDRSSPSTGWPPRSLPATLHREDLVGDTPAFLHLLKQAFTLAQSNVPLLLLGESGTGKTHLARMIHEAGPRAGAPFVRVDCTILHDFAQDEEIFGKLPGCLSVESSGPCRGNPGAIAAADHGTLFFDAIERLWPPAQSRLLRLLEHNDYRRIGDSEMRVVDVRIIAAANGQLTRAVEAFRFRGDLHQLLSANALRLPSLSERADDIEALARFFYETACARHALSPLPLSADAITALQTAVWLGNARQLRHAMEATAFLAAQLDVSQIDPWHLFLNGEGSGTIAREPPSV